MKPSKTIYIGIALLTLNACTPAIESPTVTNFEECVAAGNPIMESYPRQCSDQDQTFFEEIEKDPSLPTPPNLPLDSRNQKPCTREYQPVCGEVQVQCIKAPCPPIKTTFSNRCEAENAGVKNATEGACIDEGPNPEGACLSFDGNWLEKTQECEGMAQSQCENLEGNYNECASACRNDPNAELCTMQCVQVCQF